MLLFLFFSLIYFVSFWHNVLSHATRPVFNLERLSRISQRCLGPFRQQNARWNTLDYRRSFDSSAASRIRRHRTPPLLHSRPNQWKHIYVYVYFSMYICVCVYERACCARLRACIYVSVDVETSNGIMRPCLASNITAQFSTITVTAQGKIVVKKLITVRSKRERITSLYR